MTPHDPLSAARGIASGALAGIFIWAVLLAMVLGGCATTSPREDRGDGVCFLDGRCVPCEDTAEGCRYPVSRDAQ